MIKSSLRVFCIDKYSTLNVFIEEKSFPKAMLFLVYLNFSVREFLQVTYHVRQFPNKMCVFHDGNSWRYGHPLKGVVIQETFLQQWVFSKICLKGIIFSKHFIRWESSPKIQGGEFLTWVRLVRLLHERNISLRCLYISKFSLKKSTSRWCLL